ncbi:hypothetical protein [Halorarius halobius]|uniref:hypothetical protein n=1 Tax=Halorarius halobius TaxID=2962671 RepID=UPI0020CE5B70|nr:hypothetical protein [Halorarius halobius]
MDRETGSPTERSPSRTDGTTTETATGTETGTGTPYPYTERFDRVVDVRQRGADPTGNEPINDVLEANRGNDTLFFFPPGTYLMSDPWVVREFSNVGVVGRDATVTIPPGYKNYLFAFGEPDSARGLLFEGVDFDCSARDSGARVLEARIDDGLEVRDVTVRGVQEVDFAATRFDITSESGRGVVERLRLPDGGVAHSRAVGCYVGDQSYGALEFVDCRMESFPNNGLYASSSKGPLVVRGGYYANNGIASVRVGNGGVVRNVRVRCDAGDNGFENMRGIRLRNGASARVENCTVELIDVTYSDGAIVVEEWLESATVRDTTVRIDTDGIAALRVKPPAPTATTAASRPALTCRGVDIVGSAADNAAVSVNSRNGCLFRDVSIQQSGRRRNGIHLEQSTGNRITNSVIDVPGEAIVLENATIDTTDTRIGTPRPTSSTDGA